MSDRELLLEEDRLLLQDELSLFRQYTRWSAGRFAVLVLSIAYFGLFMGLFALLNRKFGPREGNILLIIPVLGCLWLGVTFGQRTWKASGPARRSALRTFMHYWPVSLWIMSTVIAWMASVR